MSWTAPRTWTVGQVITAASLNTDVRDNMLFLRSVAGNKVVTAETRTNVAFGDLATAGPAVTVTTTDQALVTISSKLQNNTVGGQCVVGIDVSGGTTGAASDDPALWFIASTAGGAIQASNTVLVKGLTPGSNTFTLKYRSGGADTATFTSRRIIVAPA